MKVVGIVTEYNPFHNGHKYQIEKVRKDIFSEINLDEFNRQQEITRIYVRKDETYVLEEQRGWMDWSIDKKEKLHTNLLIVSIFPTLLLRKIELLVL